MLSTPCKVPSCMSSGAGGWRRRSIVCFMTHSVSSYSSRLNLNASASNDPTCYPDPEGYFFFPPAGALGAGVGAAIEGLIAWWYGDTTRNGVSREALLY